MLCHTLPSIWFFFFLDHKVAFLGNFFDEACFVEFFFNLTDVWVVKIPHEYGILWFSQPKCYPRNFPFLLSSSPGGP